MMWLRAGHVAECVKLERECRAGPVGPASMFVKDKNGDNNYDEDNYELQPRRLKQQGQVKVN